VHALIVIIAAPGAAADPSRAFGIISAAPAAGASNAAGIRDTGPAAARRLLLLVLMAPLSLPH
jgi:hypothetical protein